MNVDRTCTKNYCDPCDCEHCECWHEGTDDCCNCSSMLDCFELDRVVNTMLENAGAPGWFVAEGWLSAAPVGCDCLVEAEALIAASGSTIATVFDRDGNRWNWRQR